MKRKVRCDDEDGGDDVDDDDIDGESVESSDATPTPEAVDVKKKPAAADTERRMLESAQNLRGRADYGQGSSKGGVGEDKTAKPERWFNGATATAYYLDFELSSISTGSLIELGIYMPPDAERQQCWFAGTIVGVVGEVVSQDAHGMEMIVFNPVGSTSELNQVLEREMSVGPNIKNVRFHLCGGAQADGCQASRGSTLTADGKTVLRGNSRTSDGWIHSNYWRLRTVEDINEGWLVGLFDYSIVIYPDQVGRRCYRRTTQSAIESIRPGTARSSGHREPMPLGDASGLGTESSGAIVPQKGTMFGGPVGDVEVLGKVHSARDGGGVAARRIPPPPVLGTDRSTAMGKVRALGETLMASSGGGAAMIPPHLTELAPGKPPAGDPRSSVSSPLVKRGLQAWFPPMPPGGSSVAPGPIEGGELGGEGQKHRALAGKFLNSLKKVKKEKKEKDVQNILANRAMSFNAKSSSAGANEGAPSKPAAMEDKVWEEVCQQLGIAADGSDLNEDGMNVPVERFRKKKKKKKKSKRRRRDSSYSSTSSSSKSSSTFRLPSSSGAGRENAIAECARKRPGRLFTQGLKTMAQYCDPTLAGARGGEVLPAAAYRYLTTLVSAAQGMNLGKRDQRELQTLAMCLDHLARGNTAGLGDVLIQRFKAVEKSATQKSWEVARHLELVPEQQFATASLKESEAAAKLMIRDSQLQRALKGQRDEGRYAKGAHPVGG